MSILRQAALAAAVSAAFAFAPPAIAAGDEFVHLAGMQAPAPAADEAPSAEIEKLLAQPADLWDRLRQGFALPAMETKRVAEYEAWYAARPELLRAILGRARLYLHYIAEEVERRGMPAELALLPVVESGFNPRALSVAQASGLWQFIPGTGARYRLAQTAQYDARRDVVASTDAALDYLQSLYQLQGDWQLALASYNWGEQAVSRAVALSRARGRGGDFASLVLPEETRNYVPRLMAIRNIVADPAKYGIDLGDLPNEPYFASVTTGVDMDVRTAARLAEMPVDEFLALNPAYNRPQIPGALRAALLVPVDRAEFLRVNLERYKEEKSRGTRSRVRAADKAKLRG
jgi:membrane-bound lytic murein transglycosylase D